MTTQARTFVPDLSAFGARLALIRWYKGWNQKEAALACGLPPGSWREWELSGRAPRNLVEVAEKIANATDAEEYWIITGKVTPGRGPDGDGGGGGQHPSQLGASPTGQYGDLPLARLLDLPAAWLVAAQSNPRLAPNLTRASLDRAA